MIALIVMASLQATPLLAAALLFRGSSATTRHLLLLAAVTASLLLPLLGALPAPRIDIPLPATAPLWPSWLAMVWLAGVVVGVVRFGRGLLLLVRLRNGGAPAGGRRSSTATGVRFRIGGNDVPLTWGLFRPVILLPAAFSSWSGERRRAVLLHELAHIDRRDGWSVLAGELARIVYWFHPLVWLAVRRMRFESERACDDAVLRAGMNGETFAADLLAIASGHGRTMLLASSATTMLEKRLTALVDDRDRSLPHRRTRFALLAAFTALTLLLGGFHAVAPWSAYAEAHGIAPGLARTILTTAEEQQIEAGLAFALVRAESGFRVDAVSPKGAVGLTQILPSTARLVERSVTRPQLFEPRTNLRVGFRLLRRHLQRYGDVGTALTAYAHGPGEVDRRLAANQPLPPFYRRYVLAARRPL